MKEQIEAVRRMQDYISANLQENITLGDLSRASLFSPWYSYRLFVKWTHYTPADYIRKMRLSLSAMRLRDEDSSVTEAAFSMGFGSVDGYQRAFFREFGCNPREYATSPRPISLFVPYKVYSKKEEEEHKKVEKVKNVFIQKVFRPACKAILKRGKAARGYFEYCDEVGCDVWGILKSVKTITGEPVSMWLPAKMIPEGTSEYVQVAQVPLDYSGEVPEGFDMIELPEGDYLMFCSEPFAEEDYCEAIEEIWEAMKKYDPSIIGLCWDEERPRIQMEPVGERGYIELRAVKEINKKQA